jgi:hypothetical protein
MRNIVFFTENKWAFGTIHNSLCKELYRFGINAEVLDWERQYQIDEILKIADSTDYFVTTPVGIGFLLNYKIPLQKIIAVAHGQWDILLARQQMGLDIFNKIAKYGTVSEILDKKSVEFGVPVKSHVVPFGIHFDRFYSKPSERLSTVAMAGAYSSQNFFGEEIKRGGLVEQAVKYTGLAFKKHNFYHYLSMPNFYKSVDCIITASTEEGAGLPMLEAAAAGKLCISTPVGYFEKNGPVGGGHVVNIETNYFLTETVSLLNYYADNHEEYKKKCLDIQEYARQNYDWKFHIDKWVDFLL